VRKNGVEAVFLLCVLKFPCNPRWKSADAKGHSSATSSSILCIISNSSESKSFCQMAFQDPKNARHGMVGAVAALHRLDSNL
jgi:hypothetical protein